MRSVEFTLSHLTIWCIFTYYNAASTIGYLIWPMNIFQWLGEADLRYKMQGRLILVHLMCRDMAPLPMEQHLLEENRTASKYFHNICVRRVYIAISYSIIFNCSCIFDQYKRIIAYNLWLFNYIQRNYKLAITNFIICVL